jgi:pantoate--beta-alanine ligase
VDRVTAIAEVRARSRRARASGARVGLVPTMGALHAGHLELVRAARAASDLVVVSIFVNPTQFGPGEDLAAYPRDLDADEAALAGLDADAPDVVFAPSVAEMYPRERATTVHVSGLTEVLCGASRPGHFDGVTTVVSKLLHIVEPDVALFGRKDFQQLAVIRTMVHDLDIGVDIVGVPTVREPDGVAMSSRNRYLTGADRTAARALSQALAAAVRAAREARRTGQRPSVGMLRDAASVTIGAHPEVRLDYLEVRDPVTLASPDTAALVGAASGQATTAAGDEPDRLLVAIAAHVGNARLIDNVVIGDTADEDRLLAATDPQ